ncbi:hypothetical protein GOV12_02735 [Candidatus Pacearchaeota archaeon]|nr:hypothetical protein [Candidatus Pacearchaeota archaeon]
MVCLELKSISDFKKVVEYVSVIRMRSQLTQLSEFVRRESERDELDLVTELLESDYDDKRSHVLECPECMEGYLWGLAKEAWDLIDPRQIDATSPSRQGYDESLSQRSKIIENNMHMLDIKYLGVFKDE